MDHFFIELWKQKEQFRFSIEGKADNPLATLEPFNRQCQIGEQDREAVKWGWEQEMGKPCSIWSMRIPERPSLKDCNQRPVTGCRRWGNGVGDGEMKAIF